MNYKHLAIATSLLSGLLAAGCGDSDSGIPFGGNAGTNPANPITAPTAGNIAFSVLGSSSTTATAANGILSVGNPNTATVVNVQSPTSRGGTITANTDGSFTYNAPALGNTTDTFTYTIQNAGGNSTGTATVTLLGRGFFVSNQAAPGGTGTQQAPFQTLAQVATAAAGVNGAEIVVFRGDGTSNLLNTPIALGGNQTLRGLDPANPPTLTGPVSFSSNNRLQDLRVFNSPTSAVNAVGANGGNIRNVSVANATVQAVDLSNAMGSFTVGNCSVQNAVLGIVWSSTVGNLSVAVNDCSFTNSRGSIFATANGNSTQTLVANGNSFTGGTDQQILVNASTAATNISLTISNNTVQGSGTALRGIQIITDGSTSMAARVLANNITNCTSEGISFVSGANSTSRLRFNDNRSLGNAPNDFNIGIDKNAVLNVSFQRNTSTDFSFAQIGNSTFNIETFSLFNTTNANIGPLDVLGTFGDIPAGSGGIP